MAENLDKQLNLYPGLPCEINEKQNCVKTLKIIRKNIFMGISHFVFLRSYLFYDLLCTSLQYLPTPRPPHDQQSMIKYD
jgi:hypothetical protein